MENKGKPSLEWQIEQLEKIIDNEVLIYIDLRLKKLKQELLEEDENE